MLRVPEREFRMGRAAAAARAARDGLLLGVSAGGSIVLARLFAHNNLLGAEFRVNAWTAGRALLHGLPVYDLPTAPAVKHFAVFDWGPLSAVLLAPFSLVPAHTASACFSVLCLASLLLTLRLCGVRDWRVYAITLTWPFIAIGWLLGNIELPLVLALALTWRYRDRPGVAGLSVALMISTKVILWPSLLFLLATRRWRAAAHACVWMVVLNAAAWATVGVRQIPRYVSLLSAVAKMARPRGSGVVSLIVHLGAGATLADGVALTIGVIAAIGCVAAGRRRDDWMAFALAVAVCLIATPIVDPYYYALLAVPLATAHPRFGVVWAIPLTIWLGLAFFGDWGHVGTTATCLACSLALAAITIPMRRVPGLRGLIRQRPANAGNRVGALAIAQLRRSS